MPLHPKIEAGLRFAARLPRIDSLTPDQARTQLQALWTGIPKGPAPELASVEDRIIASDGKDLTLRIFTPVGEGPFPIVDFIHGGGFVVGDLASYDDLCRRIAALVPAIVIAPEYRLAPEDKFPAGLDDVVATLRWSQANATQLGADPTRIAVAGDSAGGNLAAMAALRLRGSELVRAQLLMYPVADHYASDFASYRDFAEGFGLTAGEMRWFWDHYVEAGDLQSRDAASPLRAGDVAGLPKTLLVTAEYDVLRDEGEAFAARLAAAGNDVKLERASGMNHAFYMLAGALPEVDALLEQACAWLRAVLEPCANDVLVSG